MSVEPITVQEKQSEDDLLRETTVINDGKVNISSDAHLPTDMSDTTESDAEKNNKYENLHMR